jgi:rhodanese-related sulfurtransferase
MSPGMLPAMRIFLIAALFAAGVAGCSRSDSPKAAKAEPTEAAEAKLPTVSVDEVDHMLATNDCVPVDANGDATRKRMGVVPGAVLLTDSDDYKPSELPADKSKSLVFYCANTQCGASHQAAAKARLAGYTNVKVMPEGIAGWVKAGKKTQQL